MVDLACISKSWIWQHPLRVGGLHRHTDMKEAEMMKSNPGRFTRTFLAGLKGKDFAIILSQMDLDPLTGYCEFSGFRSVLFLGSAGSHGRKQEWLGLHSTWPKEAGAGIKTTALAIKPNSFHSWKSSWDHSSQLDLHRFASHISSVQSSCDLWLDWDIICIPQNVLFQSIPWTGLLVSLWCLIRVLPCCKVTPFSSWCVCARELLDWIYIPLH